MNVNDFTDYFRQLAVSHHLLRHEPTSESGDSPVGAKRFGRYSAEDVLTGLRTKVDFPALLIEMYQVKLNSNDSIFDVRRNYTAAFAIYASADPLKADDVEEAFRLTEEIMNDMLQKIWQDHYGPDHDQCETPFTDFYFTADIEPVGPIWDRQYGWRCEFEFKPIISPSITTAPVPGVFL